MNLAEWQDWLQRWLVHHSLKQPPESLSRCYTEEVMGRIRALENPGLAVRWVPQRQRRLAFGMAFACLAGLIFLAHRVPTRAAHPTVDLDEQVWQALDRENEDWLDELLWVEDLEPA